MAAFASKDFNTALDLWKHMFAPEPTYDEVRARVVKILEEKSKQ